MRGRPSMWKIALYGSGLLLLATTVVGWVQSHRRPYFSDLDSPLLTFLGRLRVDGASDEGDLVLGAFLSATPHNANVIYEPAYDSWFVSVAPANTIRHAGLGRAQADPEMFINGSAQRQIHFRIATPTSQTGFRVRTLYIRCPYWFLVLLQAIPLCWMVLRSIRNRHRFKPGHCPSCGYDLRATPDRCPECGVIPASSSVPRQNERRGAEEQSSAQS